jgi:hypothetical protein
MRKAFGLLAVVTATLFTPVGAQQRAAASDPINKIREADIKRDLFALAGDDMRGREGGTLDEMAATAWVAERAREAGLQPAGDNGTYFQFFPLERYRVSASSVITLGGKKLVLGKDAVTDAVVLANVDAPLVPVASAEADALKGLDLNGKALMVRYVPVPSTPPAATPAPGALITGPPPGSQPAIRAWVNALRRAVGVGGGGGGAGGGAAAAAPVTIGSPVAIVVVIPDSSSDQWERVLFPFTRGTYGLDPDGTSEQRTPTRGVPLLYMKESALAGAAPEGRD